MEEFSQPNKNKEAGGVMKKKQGNKHPVGNKKRRGKTYCNQELIFRQLRGE